MRGWRRTCAGDGRAFGDCVGATLPASEDRTEPGDEDCDGDVNEPDAGCRCALGAVEDCYGGPLGTEGVGPCVTGQEACLPDDWISWVHVLDLDGISEVVRTTDGDLVVSGVCGRNVCVKRLDVAGAP